MATDPCAGAGAAPWPAALDLVDGVRHGHEVVGGLHPEHPAAGEVRHLPQGLGVDDILLAVGVREVAGAERDGVDPDAELLGQPRHVARRGLTGIVGPVGHQDHHLVGHGRPGLAGLGRRRRGEALQGEAEAVADPRGTADEADGRLVESPGDGGGVEARARGDVGFVGEDHEAYPVARPAADEVGPDALDGGEAVHRLTVEEEVAPLHAAREIHHQHDLAARGRERRRGQDEAGAGQRRHQGGPQGPDQDGAAAAAGGDAVAPGRRGDEGGRHPQGSARTDPLGRHQPGSEERQGQE
jgi:hypothetical protein